MVPEEKIIDFDECPITLNSCMLLIGMRKSGKTTLLRAIVDRLYRDYEEDILGVYLYSRTAYINKKDYDFTNNIHKIDTFEVKKHMIKQEKIKLLHDRDQRVPYKNVVVILDDFISDIPSASSKEARVLDDIATMGRHFNITLIILSQRHVKISTTVRDNSSYIYCTNISQDTLFSLFSLQTDYYSKQLLWKDYNEFTKESEYSFMIIQRERPREPTVLFVKACPLVEFVDIKELELESNEGYSDDAGNN